MNVWNKLVALQVALNLLILVSCSKDGSSTEGMQCFKEPYINYQVYTTYNADDKIEDALSVRTYNNMPFFSAENINASSPYIAEEWLIRKIEEGDNPFYTHCEYFDLYYNCISVDTFYVEKCVDGL